MERKINPEDCWIGIDELVSRVVDLDLVPPESKRGRRRKQETPPENQARTYIFNRIRGGQLPPADPGRKEYPAWVLWALKDYADELREEGSNLSELVLPSKYANARVLADLRFSVYHARRLLSGAAVLPEFIRAILDRARSRDGVDEKLLGALRSTLVSLAKTRGADTRTNFIGTTKRLRGVIRAGEETLMELQGWHVSDRLPPGESRLPPEGQS